MMADPPPLPPRTIEIPIEHGTVLNPNASKHPPPLLINTLDSLASFPSIQRFQKRTTTTATIDQNANHLRSIHERHSPKARFIKIQRSPSASAATAANEKEMYRAASITLQTYPSNIQQRHHNQNSQDRIGTTVASYLDTFHPEHHYQQHEEIAPDGHYVPNGFVSKQRNFFTQQIATPAAISFESSSSSASSSSSQEESSERTFSNAAAGPISDKKKTSDIGKDYLQKISQINNSSRKKSASHNNSNNEPKVRVVGVTVADPPSNSELPTSFYLLRQSQENLVMKRKPRTSSENPPSDRSPSYRTIIKFSKNREIIPDSDRFVTV
jgi:hypothetical protein